MALCLQLLQPPAAQRAAALELLNELQSGLQAPAIYQAFAGVRSDVD